jgi:membrane protein DedA with SNARE-associated domain
VLQEVLDFIRANPGAWSLVIVGLAAALEYLVPPLPADSVVLAGSLLVVAGAWSFSTVAGVVIFGGLLGSIGHYVLGRALLTPEGELRGSRVVDRLVGPGAFEGFFELFRKHGLWVLAINRMLPGVRAAVFLAAGAARLPALPVLLLGLVSNVLWSLLILGGGVWIGGNLEKVERALGVYQSVALGVVVVGVVIAVVVVRRRRGSSDASN